MSLPSKSMLVTSSSRTPARYASRSLESAIPRKMSPPSPRCVFHPDVNGVGEPVGQPAGGLRQRIDVLRHDGERRRPYEMLFVRNEEAVGVALISENRQRTCSGCCTHEKPSAPNPILRTLMPYTSGWTHPAREGRTRKPIIGMTPSVAAHESSSGMRNCRHGADADGGTLARIETCRRRVGLLRLSGR